MATFRLATPQELAQIKASVEAAVEKLKRISWNTFKPKRGRLHIPNPPRLPDNDVCQSYLQRKEIRKIILDALERGDGHFFKTFGETLSKTFTFIQDAKYPLVQVLPAFMVDHWARAKDGFPPFCYLRPSDLTQICSVELMDDSLTEDAIVKTRQRLKLKPHKSKLLPTKYASDGTPVFPKVDK